MVWRCVSSTATVGSLFTGGRLAVELFELIDMLRNRKLEFDACFILRGAKIESVRRPGESLLPQDA